MQVRLAANSCVTKDIKEPGDYGGFPAVRIFFYHVCSVQILLIIDFLWLLMTELNDFFKGNWMGTGKKCVLANWILEFLFGDV